MDNFPLFWDTYVNELEGRTAQVLRKPRFKIFLDIFRFLKLLENLQSDDLLVPARDYC
jgi:hypothetical protein